MPLPIISASYRPSGIPPPFANHTSRVLGEARHIRSRARLSGALVRPRAAPIDAGVVMSRSSNSRPIAIRRQIVVSRSACRARRSSDVSLGLAGSGWSGGRSGNRLMPARWS